MFFNFQSCLFLSGPHHAKSATRRDTLIETSSHGSTLSQAGRWPAFHKKGTEPYTMKEVNHRMRMNPHSDHSAIECSLQCTLCLSLQLSLQKNKFTVYS